MTNQSKIIGICEVCGNPVNSMQELTDHWLREHTAIKQIRESAPKLPKLTPDEILKSFMED